MARIFLDNAIEGDIWTGYRLYAVYFNDVTKLVESDFLRIWSIGQPTGIMFGFGEKMYEECAGTTLYEVYKQQAQPFGNVVTIFNAASCVLLARNSTTIRVNDGVQTFGDLASDVCVFNSPLQVFFQGNLGIGSGLELEDTSPLPYDGDGWFRIGLDAYQINGAGEVIDIVPAECEVVPDPDPVTPLPDLAAEARFHLPVASSITFVKDEAVTDQNDVNTLFEKQEVPGMLNLNFFQTVKKDSVLTIQWGSSYDTNNLVLKSYKTGVTQATISGELVQQNLNQELTLPAFALTDPETAGVQIYFPNYPFPDFAIIGNSVNVTGESLNGQFDVIGIAEGKGLARGNRVLIIDSPVLLALTVQVTVTGKYNRLGYNVYEADITLDTLGKYLMEIAVTDSVFEAQKAISEPIKVTQDLEEYTRLDYTNDNDEYGCFYGNDIVHRRWIKSRLYKATVGGEKTINRETTARLVKLDEYVTKALEWEVFQIPPYLVTQISIALAHDEVAVKGIGVQTEEQIEIEYFLPEPLANGVVRLEEVEFTQKNREAGNIDTSDSFLLINTGSRLIINE